MKQTPTDFSVYDSNDLEHVGWYYNGIAYHAQGHATGVVATDNKQYKSWTHYAIMKGIYNDKQYENIAALRVGWEAEYSPFNKSFDKTFLKRIRAYDNNGEEFDIEMNFKILKNNRYISDGDKDKITIPKDKENSINNIYNLEINTY